jgi:hypothetical protein
LLNLKKRQETIVACSREKSYPQIEKSWFKMFFLLTLKCNIFLSDYPM